MTCSCRTDRETITLDVNEPFVSLVYATKQLQRRTSISGFVGDRQPWPSHFQSEANMISLMNTMDRREGKR